MAQLAALGIPASNVINRFFAQKITFRGVSSPARQLDISRMSVAELSEELEKGYVDMKAGRTKFAKAVFADIRKDYAL